MLTIDLPIQHQQEYTMILAALGEILMVVILLVQILLLYYVIERSTLFSSCKIDNNLKVHHINNNKLTQEQQESCFTVGEQRYFNLLGMRQNSHCQNTLKIPQNTLKSRCFKCSTFNQIIFTGFQVFQCLCGLINGAQTVSSKIIGEGVKNTSTPW